MAACFARAQILNRFTARFFGGIYLLHKLSQAVTSSWIGRRQKVAEIRPSEKDGSPFLEGFYPKVHRYFNRQTRDHCPSMRRAVKLHPNAAPVRWRSLVERRGTIALSPTSNPPSNRVNPTALGVGKGIGTASLRK
jgi:hypothetical protein